MSNHEQAQQVQPQVQRPQGTNAKAAAKRIGVSVATLYRMAAAGEIGSIRRGRRWIIPEHCVDSFLNQAS
jgi:excisionase family DNA binding protein